MSELIFQLDAVIVQLYNFITVLKNLPKSLIFTTLSCSILKYVNSVQKQKFFETFWLTYKHCEIRLFAHKFKAFSAKKDGKKKFGANT